jgi:hypothetical protein
MKWLNLYNFPFYCIYINVLNFFNKNYKKISMEYKDNETINNQRK